MEFNTSDKGLTAFLLLCKGIKYLGQESDRGILLFRFSPYELSEQKKTEYETSNQLLVQPLQYFEKIRLVTRWIGEWRDLNKTNYNGFYK